MERSVYTPDVVKRIRKMKLNGASAAYIAEVTGIPLASLERRCSQLGIYRAGRVGTLLSQKTERRFNAEAARRGMKPHSLLRKLVTAIVKDNLFDAVIDADERTKG